MVSVIVVNVEKNTSHCRSSIDYVMYVNTCIFTCVPGHTYMYLNACMRVCEHVDVEIENIVKTHIRDSRTLWVCN